MRTAVAIHLSALSLLLFLTLGFSVHSQGQTLELDKWQYTEVDSLRQKWGDWNEPEWLRYFGLDAADINKDGYLDIISGRYFYLNPGGNMEAGWRRTDLGMNVDAYLFADIDGDEFADVIGLALPSVLWLESDDRKGTSWTMHKIGELPKTGHVNSQGYRHTQLLQDGRGQILFAVEGGIHACTIPEDPNLASNWKFFKIIPTESDEGIGVGDIDGDGDLDIACGDIIPGQKELPTLVNWHENPGSVSSLWEKHSVGATIKAADRFEVADVDGDGKADIIVSEEMYPGLEPEASVFVYTNPGNPEQENWNRKSLLTTWSVNNLDVADLDNDGDVDIVSCEHKGQDYRRLIFENDGKGNFTMFSPDQGHESHLGAQLFDLDNDGDLDMVSIGWDHYQYLHLWRNDAISLTSVHPGPGDVFREYVWVTPGNGQSEQFLRVCGDGLYDEPTNKGRKLFPEGFVDDGWLTLDPELDLEDAIRAEIVVERMLCHDGSTGLAVKFNQGKWHAFPDADSIPQPQSEYLYHYYPSIQIPISELKDGVEANRFRFTLNPGQRFGMPQNMVYGLVLRIYYKPSKPHAEAEISGLSSGDSLGEELLLNVKSKSAIKKVEYIGLMDNLNYEGDGVYYQWHYNYHRGELVNHIGTSSTGEYLWNTEWVPDQYRAMQIAARVTDENGIIYMTPAIENLHFERDYKVELCKPYNIPRRWATRESEFVAGFDVKGDLSRAESFLVSAVTWSPGYLNGVYLNDFLIMDRESCKYCYHIIRREFNETAFLSGMNSLKTGKTPYYNGNMVHGTEIQYPGFMVLLRYKSE